MSHELITGGVSFGRKRSRIPTLEFVEYSTLRHGGSWRVTVSGWHHVGRNASTGAVCVCMFISSIEVEALSGTS